jgi:hypothetical protein
MPASGKTITAELWWADLRRGGHAGPDVREHRDVVVNIGTATSSSARI